MRVFILPSWCPNAAQPLSGTFFVEQAHAMALLRPDWIVALCQFDLARSRMPWRPRDVSQFMKDWLSIPQLERLEAHSGLQEYRVWAPYLPSFGRQRKWVVNVNALASQAKLALEDFIQRFGRPDLIHAQAVYPGGAAAVDLGQEYGIPVGLTEHLGPFPPPTLCLPDGQVIPLVADAYAGASRCSAVSQSLADRVRQLGLADEVTVLPNFLPDQFGSGVEQQRPAGGKFSFLSVGGPSYAKGTDELLRALAKVSSDVTLRVVGDGSEMTFFQQLAADLGVSQRVQWLGAVPRDQMSELYQACDAFVLPSQGETFGIAFIEALAFGKPLIATRCGGPEDIVNTGNGLLVPLNSGDGLVAAMKDMVANAGLYKPEALREDFLARFSASAALAGIEAWYLAVIRTGELKVAS
jgi:glycosyltransferase involved in cell wall biosynthesis